MRNNKNKTTYVIPEQVYKLIISYLHGGKRGVRAEISKYSKTLECFNIYKLWIIGIHIEYVEKNL